LWTKTVGGLAIAMLAGVLLATVPAAPPASADDRDEARAAALAAKQGRIARRLEDARRRGDAGAVAREQRRAEKVAARQARMERRLDRAGRQSEPPSSTAGARVRDRRTPIDASTCNQGGECLPPPGYTLPPGWYVYRDLEFGRFVYRVSDQNSIEQGTWDDLKSQFDTSPPDPPPDPDPPPSVTPPPSGTAPPPIDWSGWQKEMDEMQGIVPPYRVRGAPAGGHWSNIKARPVKSDGSGRCPTTTAC
jgi:hypothetical protein